MAGRPKGSKNVRTLEIEAIISRYPLNPFEVLMMISAGDWKGLGFETKTHTTFTQQGIEIEEENIPIAIRCQAAKEAVQYIFPKKKIITVDITKEEAIRVLENEFNAGGIQLTPESERQLLTSGNEPI